MGERHPRFMFAGLTVSIRLCLSYPVIPGTPLVAEAKGRGVGVSGDGALAKARESKYLV